MGKKAQDENEEEDCRRKERRRAVEAGEVSQRGTRPARLRRSAEDGRRGIRHFLLLKIRQKHRGVDCWYPSCHTRGKAEEGRREVGGKLVGRAREGGGGGGWGGKVGRG